jgi:hypothetical protein
VSILTHHVVVYWIKILLDDIIISISAKAHFFSASLVGYKKAQIIYYHEINHHIHATLAIIVLLVATYAQKEPVCKKEGDTLLAAAIGPSLASLLLSS